MADGLGLPEIINCVPEYTCDSDVTGATFVGEVQLNVIPSAPPPYS